MYTDNTSTFLWQIHWLEFQGFTVELFTVLWIYRKSSSIIIGFYLYLKSYRHMIFLHLESFENKLVD